LVPVRGLDSQSSMTEAQAKHTRDVLRRLYESRPTHLRHASATELKFLELLLNGFNDMVDAQWPSKND
jgi:hypothetical protein